MLILSALIVAVALPLSAAAQNDNPTSKADCKKGGWAAFGFDSQGQCIRYTRTGKDSRPTTVVEVDFENVPVSTAPCPACVLSAPASLVQGAVTGASFGWTDTDGVIGPNCSGADHGVRAGYGLNSTNVFVGRHLGSDGSLGPGSDYYVALESQTRWRMRRVTLDVFNNGGYVNPVNVVAAQDGIYKVIGTFSLPGNQGATTVDLPVSHAFKAGPAEIRLEVQGIMYLNCSFNAYVAVDNLRFAE